jgi:hypothetical protein
LYSDPNLGQPRLLKGMTPITGGPLPIGPNLGGGQGTFKDNQNPVNPGWSPPQAKPVAGHDDLRARMSKNITAVPQRGRDVAGGAGGYDGMRGRGIQSLGTAQRGLGGGQQQYQAPNSMPQQQIKPPAAGQRFMQPQRRFS